MLQAFSSGTGVMKVMPVPFIFCKNYILFSKTVTCVIIVYIFLQRDPESTGPFPDAFWKGTAGHEKRKNISLA